MTRDTDHRGLLEPRLTSDPGGRARTAGAGRRRAIRNGGPSRRDGRARTAQKRRQPGGTPRATASSALAPEGTEDAGAQAGVDRAQQHRHDPEGSVPVPVGHGPGVGSRTQAGRRLVGLGVAGNVGVGRGVGEQHHGGPAEALEPGPVAGPASLVSRGIEVDGRLLGPLEHDPGRAAGVAGGGGAQRRLEDAVDDRRGRPARARSSAPWRGGGWPRGAPWRAVSHCPERPEVPVTRAGNVDPAGSV